MSFEGRRLTTDDRRPTTDDRRPTTDDRRNAVVDCVAATSGSQGLKPAPHPCCGI
jgi:hypothetical protein